MNNDILLVVISSVLGTVWCWPWARKSSRYGSRPSYPKWHKYTVLIIWRSSKVSFPKGIQVCDCSTCGVCLEHGRRILCQRQHSKYTSLVCEFFKTGDRKSTRLNSSHANISYAVFCLKKKK